MSIFILVIALLAWRWPVAALVVAGVLAEYWWEERKGVLGMAEWTEYAVPYTTQLGGMCMVKGCTNKRTGADNLCDEHSSKTGTAVYGQPTRSATHPCPIQGCEKTVAFAKLMCWDHWATVPVKIRSNVYTSWNDGRPLPDHARHCQDAIDSIQKG